MLSHTSRVIAVYGIPGAGKTTLARHLAETMDAAFVSSGDIARNADPESIAAGHLADEERIKDALVSAIWEPYDQGRLVVVDGAPRAPFQVAYMPKLTTAYLWLDCWPEVAIRRQIDRGRPGDDDITLVEGRTWEQFKLMEFDSAVGWAASLADIRVEAGSRNAMQVRSVAMSHIAAALLDRQRPA